MIAEFSNVANLPTKFGKFKIQSVREKVQNGSFEHCVVFSENLGDIPLVRVHSECMTGDVFGSLKCDCGNELNLAMEKISQDPMGGMLIYLRQEGRGIGLLNKINAYALQDRGYDTLEANRALGLEDDARNYDVVGEIFQHFGIKKLRLLTNNPAKIKSLKKFAEIERSSIIIPSNCYNEHYLKVKRDKMGHLL
ncbi:GTP cyclohydrolase II [Helicobacter mustelae]|uniref:GTP cyclohydrolase-2 n=1 Tax=Helicobacter mustelae (strain ATCC 43772 / CCUG 25715 / CIP 103759 / LMG 18044 / NCTC 12198 / R85-136P) TaxID=679897 RepID=D3UHG3_HELM1|nr:GTP cyclohydrolase II [Helicobacter mustelae]CBG39935.1 GTP cyclohydrolase II [Helicobacter mustelae 12198]SQH71445.1 GTP cyclohydrolase II [Helicobacter mustelae]STP12572.1 GTP cyclohydrolase II [Helicobacter mustelae]